MYVNILCVLFLGEWFDFSSLFINRWPNWFNKSLGFETIKRWNYRNSALKSVSNTVFPHIVSAETILFWIQPYVLWPLVTVHTGAETIQGRKLFKGGNYMRKYGICFLSLHILSKSSWLIWWLKKKRFCSRFHIILIIVTLFKNHQLSAWSKLSLIILN